MTTLTIFGRRPDGSVEEQPGSEKVEQIKEDTEEAERNEDDEGDANPSPMNPAFP